MPDNKEIFETVVVATMSSGKSTFVNALLGWELMPTKNEACSAKNIMIANNDDDSKRRVMIKYRDNTRKLVKSVSAELIREMNDDDNVKNIIVNTNIEGMYNSDRRSMVLVDTPGINNYMDENHRNRTMALLSKIETGMLVYLLNFTQMCNEDDNAFLKNAVRLSHMNSSLKIIFVLNKIDCIDSEKESILGSMKSAVRYLEDNGVKSPDIFPASSLAYTLFKKAAAEQPMSRKEISEFRRLFGIFRPQEYSLKYYSVQGGRIDDGKIISVANEKYDIRELYAAMDNTGIPEVKYHIQKIMNT